MSSLRLDKLLVMGGFARSRTQAQEMIGSGRVTVSGQVIKDPAQTFQEGDQIKVETLPDDQLVSRGAIKLRGALEHLNFSVNGLDVLDIGISTGGFTQILLERGAQFVTGIDVGRGQVSPQLMSDKRLVIFEKTNARELTPEFFDRKFDLIVMDVSFISATLIIPKLKELLIPDAFCLILVKPQFEVGPLILGKGGIVPDNPKHFTYVRERIESSLESHGFKILDYFESPIKGGDGNREFFCFAQSCTKNK